MSPANRELRAPLARLTWATARRGEPHDRRRCAGGVRLVADVARVGGYLPPVAWRLEARAQVDKPVRGLCLYGGVERREEYAALPLAMRRTKNGSGLGRWRWVVERTFAWLNQFRRLRVRYDKRADIHEAFLSLGCFMDLLAVAAEG